MPTTTGVACRNAASIKLSDDGTARLVLAAQDPGSLNWLDTGGRRHRTLALRWVGADSYPLPTVTAVPFAKL
jgi:hypothetical protein